MTILESQISSASESFQRNREQMLTLLQRVRQIESDTRDKSAAARPRFEERGQLLPQERVGLLLDQPGAFLELSTLAGYGMKAADAQGRLIAGGGLIAGIGEIHGVACMICASDSGIEAGAFQPKGLEKMLRMQEIALKNRLPYLQLIESAGGNLTHYNVENFVRGGEKYRNLARLSAAGIPVITITHGASTAGGAYQTGLSDYIIMVQGRSRAYLAGPALLKAATGEVSSDEDLGGAEMHCSVSGLGDYLARDDRDAIRIAREIVAMLHWNRETSFGQRSTAGVPHDVAPPALPRYDTEELLGLMPADDKTPVDMREIIARIVDGSVFQEFGARYGAATVCGHARIDGMPIGIITNNGPIDPDGAAKATHFIQACCQSNTPLLYLNNTTGFMVGRTYEEAGSIKHGSKMIQAITNATVPQITIFCGASFGAGHYAMCGRAFDPRFCFSWPNARCAIMGGEQAALTMTTVARAKLIREGKPVDEGRMDKLRANIIDNFQSQMDVFATSARLLDDGVIDPRETRAVLAWTLRLCRDAERRDVQPMQFSVARP